MRFTCVPGSLLAGATYCDNWKEFEFYLDGKQYPSWRVRLADDVVGEIQLFLVNEFGGYLSEGQYDPPAFETVKGKVKILAMPCKQITNCEQGRMAKKRWWDAIKP